MSREQSLANYRGALYGGAAEVVLSLSKCCLVRCCAIMRCWSTVQTGYEVCEEYNVVVVDQEREAGSGGHSWLPCGNTLACTW